MSEGPRFFRVWQSSAASSSTLVEGRGGTACHVSSGYAQHGHGNIRKIATCHRPYRHFRLLLWCTRWWRRQQGLLNLRNVALLVIAEPEGRSPVRSAVISMQHSSRVPVRSMLRWSRMLQQGGRSAASAAATAGLHTAPGDPDWALCGVTATSDRATTICVQGSHTITVDAPVDQGGHDAAPGPVAHFLGSLVGAQQASLYASECTSIALYLIAMLESCGASCGQHAGTCSVTCADSPCMRFHADAVILMCSVACCSRAGAGHPAGKGHVDGRGENRRPRSAGRWQVDIAATDVCCHVASTLLELTACAQERCMCRAHGMRMHQGQAYTQMPLICLRAVLCSVPAEFDR